MDEMWNVMMCFQPRPETDTKFCQQSTIHVRARLKKTNEMFVSLTGEMRGWHYGSMVMPCLACWEPEGRGTERHSAMVA